MTRTMILMTVLCGCATGSGEPDDRGQGGFAGVGQGGAQDFGQFRQILDEGGIPGPETLDDVGFFNEHVIELPPPTCGDDVCLHAIYGAMDNMISGSPCTLLLLGMNTPIDPASLSRPPLDLTLVLDDSRALPTELAEDLQAGLTEMLAELQPTDRVSVVRYGRVARLAAAGEAPVDLQDGSVFAELGSQSESNLYDGLRMALDHLAATRRPDADARVVLVSAGAQTAGVQSPARIRELARVRATEGIAISTVGLGPSFDLSLVRDLAEIGQGAFYFVEDGDAVQEVFTEEVRVFLTPIAEDARITVAPSAPWDPRELYGTELYDIPAPEVDIWVPTLQIAGRTVPSDDATGRRGGGGALVLEMMPSGEGRLVGDVGVIDFSYRVPGGDEIVTQQIVPHVPEREDTRFFENDQVEKAFVMLNVYAGFEMATEAAALGDDGAAWVVLEALDLNVGRWLRDHPDPDIQDDLVYIERFIENLLGRSPSVRRPAVDEPWPVD